MKKNHIALIILAAFAIGFIGAISTAAADPGDVQVAGDKHQVLIQAQTPVIYQFRARTRIRVNGSMDMDVEMDCDALKIGDTTFSIDIESEGETYLNMTCRETAERLGVQNGSTIRTLNRYRVREQFAIKIQTNRTVQARLGLEMAQGDADRTSWAYFDEAEEEWVPVASAYENGMLYAETDHFSVWTIIEDSETISAGFWTFVGIGFVAVFSIAAVLMRKKKLTISH